LLHALVGFVIAALFLWAGTRGPQVDATGYWAINAAASILLIFTLPCWVLVVVGSAMWLHRAAANLPALGGSELRFTPGWAVGWWFVPLANLVLPVLIMTEIWRASDPSAGITDRLARSKLPFSLVILVCWMAWLALIVLLVLTTIFPGTAFTNQQKFVLFTVGSAGSVAEAGCLALTLLVLRRVESRQVRKRSFMIAGALSPSS
jgi:hypothetical protein